MVQERQTGSNVSKRHHHASDTLTPELPMAIVGSDEWTALFRGFTDGVQLDIEGQYLKLIRIQLSPTVARGYMILGQITIVQYNRHGRPGDLSEWIMKTEKCSGYALSCYDDDEEDFQMQSDRFWGSVIKPWAAQERMMTYFRGRIRGRGAE
ncbi:hypothetical protein GQ43DRAFT_435734 [Delitschia confertaspora ATCC 74209]|uniref:Uncharacterized protein n=1 Tax=Delitschia confertaspora ATCC 74209 TaxID=1513339 RepID=A0A9P4MN50_9PLEO|nr:hypothetical protein GQ43DRAFT_435734 [Delitschia confertaspora ATCC 74209]